MPDLLIERLRAWSPLIANGFVSPAASPVMNGAANRIEALNAELAEKDALLWECATVITTAIFWNSHNEAGVAAIWLEDADATLAKIRDSTDD